MFQYQNIAYTEPEFKCPECGKLLHTNYVDIGFGPYSQQVDPYHCEDCKWVEGCPHKDKCVGKKCHSYEICYGGKECTSTK